MFKYPIVVRFNTDLVSSSSAHFHSLLKARPGGKVGEDGVLLMAGSCRAFRRKMAPVMGVFRASGPRARESASGRPREIWVGRQAQRRGSRIQETRDDLLDSSARNNRLQIQTTAFQIKNIIYLKYK